MQVILKELVVKRLSSELSAIGYAPKEDRYGNREDDLTIDLTERTKNEVLKLRELLHASQTRGTKVIVADIDKYLKAADVGAGITQARTVRQAAWLMEQYIAGLPNHIIFNEDEYGGNSHSGYLVTDVDYQPEIRNESRRQPEALLMRMVYIKNDVREVRSWALEKPEVLCMSPLEILKEQGCVPETPELIEKLKAETVRYYDIREQVGVQYEAVGFGFSGLDTLGATDNNWRTVRMDNAGAHSRVVIDVLHEVDQDKDRSGRDASVDPYRWHNWNMRFFAPSEDELVKHLRAEENSDDRPDYLVPVHPIAPVFDLKRHQRLNVHINNLTKYVYNKKVAERLVLPERDWKMVNLLVDHSRNFFQDVVSGKGQSMNVLSEGPPGTGKTVTAEVFAEFKERPLYTIQCSQLGMTPKEVEKNLVIVMARANRWNAVLLLDEADVYIRKRGEDIQQNAIVGAFLRVLEYASCILFMTTNLPEDVDDAIASRCIARLSYGPPGPVNQARIWRALADINGLVMSDADIKTVCEAHPELSGRDVKNLLKLASFVAQSDGKPVTAETVEYALLFKPTQSAKAAAALPPDGKRAGNWKEDPVE